jgi:hypothetical protein
MKPVMGAPDTVIVSQRFFWYSYHHRLSVAEKVRKKDECRMMV